MLDYNQPCNRKAFDVYPVELFKKAGYAVHTQVPGVHHLTSNKHNAVRVYVDIKANRDRTQCKIEVQNLTVSEDYAKIKELFDGIIYDYAPLLPVAKRAIPKNKFSERVPDTVPEIIPETAPEPEKVIQMNAPVQNICDIIKHVTEAVFDGTLNFD